MRIIRDCELRIEEVARLWRENPEFVAANIKKIRILQKEYLEALKQEGQNPNQLMFPAFLEAILR